MVELWGIEPQSRQFRHAEFVPVEPDQPRSLTLSLDYFIVNLLKLHKVVRGRSVLGVKYKI